MFPRAVMTRSAARAALCFAVTVLLMAGSGTAAGPDPGVSARLATFDDLDFNVFTHQKWDQLRRSHPKDIVVHWPDGHQTKGIDKHIEDLKAMFVYAPDTRIRVHPVKFGSGDWTSVIGVMEGTFTKPMPAAGGKTNPPPGKPQKREIGARRARHAARRDEGDRRCGN